MTDAPDIIVATVPKNSRERIAVALRSFKGNRFVDLRIQFPDGDDWKFTAKGFGIKPQMLTDLIDGLVRAREAAKSEGLIR